MFEFFFEIADLISDFFFFNTAAEEKKRGKKWRLIAMMFLFFIAMIGLIYTLIVMYG